MADTHPKLIIAPVDGSDNSLNALAYLGGLFSGGHPVKIVLFYVLPALPPLLLDEQQKDRALARKLEALKTGNLKLAERILAGAAAFLCEKGVPKDRIETVYREKQRDTALDICDFAAKKRADAVMLNTRGRSRIEAFMMGEVARKVMEHTRICPVWITKGSVASNRILIAVDGSDNALKAVDHAGFMLSGTDCHVTLFHTMPNLRRYVPRELLADAADLEAFYRQKAGRQIAPCMKKARDILVKAGLREDQIADKIVHGTRCAATDIIRAAKKDGCGTIVLGHRGLSGIRDFFMGSVTRKVLDDMAGMSVWIIK